MSLALIAALPFLGALLPGLMIRAGRNSCATITFSVTGLALIGLLMNAPAVLREDFRASLFAAFEDGEIEAQLAEAGLQHLRIEHPTDRHVHVWGPLEPI